MDARGRIEGTKTSAHTTQFYGLSTCIWCKKARLLLEELGVGFDFVYVDLIPADERDALVAQLERLGGGEIFPTLVVDDAVCIVGFEPDKIRKALAS